MTIDQRNSITHTSLLSQQWVNEKTNVDVTESYEIICFDGLKVFFDAL